MADSSSETSRTDLDFGWVSDLPTYTGLLPVNPSSLLPRFSLFSLFRSSRPSLPREDQLEPLFSRSSTQPISIGEATKGLTALSEYIASLKTACVDVTEDRAEEAEGWVLQAMEGYLVAISVVARAMFAADGTDTTGLSGTISQSLRGLFTIHAHYIGGTSSAITAALDRIVSNLLAAPHIQPEGDDTSNHLVPIFVQTREIISHLQHAARASHVKAAVVLSSEDEAGKWESRAEERMEWLRLFADHVRGLGGLPAMVKEEEPKGKAKKVTKKATKLAEQEAQERPMRIGIEADLLRCDLAISMATAKIGEVKRRARAGLSAVQVGVDVVKEEVVKEEVAVRDKKPVLNRRRRALTDESDLGTIVDQDEWLADAPAAKLDSAGESGRRWEDDVDVGLWETLGKVRAILEGKHAEVLVARIDRSDWLDDPSPPDPRGSVSPYEPPRTDTAESESDGSASPSSSSESDSDESEDDLSHSCPLRTLFRLHDRYEEQRLAVWLSLQNEQRGKMGAYMRGVEGRVGSAWDAVGLRLLMEFDADTLEAYGLSPDKHDKWVELASRRNTKKIKKGRKTV
ncbi:uncharacterized protein MKK02DRAFT_41153 [Dioszegia hungarica]|uniref:Uncharacterized protein n=1 Tax=Dioszegia hungarica TaxID=4972 RepID=A0AA38H2T2_9TREE|nr:uncharacterized protein MKK02DRAFT_41153 [Dioszegia hungarica]KAI9632842.1 hypothetical protein MKK02DRAFT_41153 [Dioszegia hungarica]